MHRRSSYWSMNEEAKRRPWPCCRGCRGKPSHERELLRTLNRSLPCNDHRPRSFLRDEPGGDGARTASTDRGGAEGTPGENTPPPLLRGPCVGSSAKHEADRRQQPSERNDAAPRQRLHQGPCQGGAEQEHWRRTGEGRYGLPLDASGRSAA